MASARSAGSPHTPRPVSCIAPNPSRFTGSFPLIANTPLLAAGAEFAPEDCVFMPAPSGMEESFFLNAFMFVPLSLDSGRQRRLQHPELFFTNARSCGCHLAIR